jgi:hypothetical protein
MATTLQNLVGTATSKVTISAGSSYTSPSWNISDYAGIAVGASVNFGATPDGDVLVEIYTSPDGSRWDDIPFTQFRVPEVASTPRQKTIRVGPEMPYLRVKVINNDSADPVDVWVYGVGKYF